MANEAGDTARIARKRPEKKKVPFRRACARLDGRHDPDECKPPQFGTRFVSAAYRWFVELEKSGSEDKGFGRTRSRRRWWWWSTSVDAYSARQDANDCFERDVWKTQRNAQPINDLFFCVRPTRVYYTLRAMCRKRVGSVFAHWARAGGSGDPPISTPYYIYRSRFSDRSGADPPEHGFTIQVRSEWVGTSSASWRFRELRVVWSARPSGIRAVYF